MPLAGGGREAWEPGEISMRPPSGSKRFFYWCDRTESWVWGNEPVFVDPRKETIGWMVDVGVIPFLISC